ncbi:hypothetical protein CTI12_AA538960 [Artemisia annua]|uniref:Uncharacterized protein n=1 Tax=Artemisia annua TaxID=35608 RepID=A0A2U1L258_ARTAN|nr:hypothetical protein CTI12_AA538960 [Artemisia annua]
MDMESRETDIIRNTVQSIFECVKEKVPAPLDLSSIYMAPSSLRDLSPSSFDPRVVSIGPLHRDDANVQAFEEQKATFVADLLIRLESSPEQTLEACVHKVIVSIDRTKACYAGIKDYSDIDFAKIMVMDACFILEFMCKVYERSQASSFLKTTSHFLKRPVENTNILLEQSIYYDLVLLENQIPLFVLNDIFECTIMKFEPFATLFNFIAPIFEFLNLFEAKLNFPDISTITYSDHILGLLHKCYKPPDNNKSSDFPSSTIYSVVELDRAGVNFQPNRDEEWPLAIKVRNMFPCFPLPWCKPVLRMPVLRINHFTELVLRNLIAYEQSSRDHHSYVTSYAIAMDMLINTKDDVSMLVESAVLINHMGSNEEAANMMNKICKEVAWWHFLYSKEWKILSRYCNGYWPKKVAWLRRTYFNSPWNIIALVAGVVLFALTVIQTLYAIKPAGNNS